MTTEIHSDASYNTLTGEAGGAALIICNGEMDTYTDTFGAHHPTHAEAVSCYRSVKQALVRFPDTNVLNVYCDNESVVNGMMKRIDWKCGTMRNLTKIFRKYLTSRNIKFTFIHVKAHTQKITIESVHNEWADRHAKKMRLVC